MQSRQTADPAERIMLVGDFNAFEFNDGLADVLCVISGMRAPDNETVVPGDGSDLVNPDLDNLHRYQWYTNFSWAGTCRMFVLKLANGTQHYAKFQF